MNAPGTKIMCSLFALITLSFSAASLVFMGERWARYLTASTMLGAVAIGFPAAVLALARKIRDDRGRNGMYNYFDETETRATDKFHAVYVACTAALAISASMMWIESLDTFIFTPKMAATFAKSDLGTQLTREDVTHMIIFFSNLGLIASLAVAYLQRAKGRYLAIASLVIGLTFAALSLLLYASS
jgi:hypothetical protein